MSKLRIVAAAMIAAGTFLVAAPTAANASWSGLNPYRYPYSRGPHLDGHGYSAGECVSFAAWAVRNDGLRHRKSPDHLGNADNWRGAQIDYRPRVGDIAQWWDGHDGAGRVGHVAYVAGVHNNGTITVYEYNWGRYHHLNIRTISARTPSRYLHF